MGALKVVGGIFSIIGGTLVLLVTLALMVNLPLFNPVLLSTFYGSINITYPEITWVNLGLAVLAIVGGILGCAGKKNAGGALALAAAVYWTIDGFLLVFALNNLFTPYSAFLLWTTVSIWIFSIEALLTLLGAIFMLSAGED